MVGQGVEVRRLGADAAGRRVRPAVLARLRAVRAISHLVDTMGRLGETER